MIRRVLYYFELLVAFAVAFGVLAMWMGFAGPQMHVAETFSGIGFAFVLLLLLMYMARKRLNRREEAAAELQRKAEAERMRQEEAEARRRRQEEDERMEALEREQARRRKKEEQESARKTKERKNTDKQKTRLRRDKAGEKDNRVSDFVDDLLSGLTAEEQLSLRNWLEDLLEIRKIPSWRVQLKRLAANLRNSTAIAPVAKLILVKLKKHGWDDLGYVAKWTVGAGGGALLLFGGAGAGIAAFGGAIGVPLFVVFGAGGALAGVIIKEIDRR